MSEVLIKNQYNEKGQRHGYWEHLWSDGHCMAKGMYVNGKRQGCWQIYNIKGVMFRKTYCL